jgi:hypothetical protein
VWLCSLASAMTNVENVESTGVVVQRMSISSEVELPDALRSMTYACIGAAWKLDFSPSLELLFFLINQPLGAARNPGYF